MAKFFERCSVLLLLTVLAVRAKEIDWLETLDQKNGTISNKAIEMGESYYLYVAKSEDLQNILDQLAEVLKDLEIDDLRKWYLMQMQAIGYVVKLPLIKGQEHRYEPILKKYGIVSLNNRRRLTLPDTSLPITSTQSTPAFSAEESSYTDEQLFQVSDYLTATAPDMRRTRLDNKNLATDTARKSDQTRWAKVGIASHPSTSTQVATEELKIVPQDDDPAISISEDSQELVAIIDSTEEEKAVLSDAADYHKVSREHTFSIPREDDDVETQFTFETTPSPLVLQDKFVGKSVQHQKLPTWFVDNVAYNTPRYSVLDLFYMFTLLAEQMGYVNESYCNARVQETTPPAIQPHMWVNALRIVENEMFNVGDSSGHLNGPPTARRVYSATDNADRK